MADDLKTKLWKAAQNAAYGAEDSGGRVPVELDYYELTGEKPPKPPAGLSPEQKQAFERSIAAAAKIKFESGLRNPNDVVAALEDAVDYQRDAMAELAENYATLVDPNADQTAKENAQISINQLSVSDMGDILNPDSPLTNYRENGGQAYFNSDQRWGSLSPEQKESILANPPHVDPNDPGYYVGDKVEDAISQYAGGPDYTGQGPKGPTTVGMGDIGRALAGKDEQAAPTGLGMPEREVIRVEDIDPRVMQADERIDPAIADELISKWADPDFVKSIDKTGEAAIRDSLGYYGDLLDNEGRDAVSDAFMHQERQRAEQLRRANVDAALANLDARGMGGGGAELQARLQGAGDSMKAQFDASMQAAAMAQQRRDNAADQQAIHGNALQMLADGRATTMAEAIDMATTDRVKMKAELAGYNADKATGIHDANQDWRERQSLANAQLAEGAAGQVYGTEAGEQSARFRNMEQVSRDIFGARTGAADRDAGVKLGIDTGNVDRTTGGRVTAAGYGQTVRANDLAEQAQEAAMAPPTALDVFLGALPVVGQTAGTIAGMPTAYTPPDLSGFAGNKPKGRTGSLSTDEF